MVGLLVMYKHNNVVGMPKNYQKNAFLTFDLVLFLF